MIKTFILVAEIISAGDSAMLPGYATEIDCEISRAMLQSSIVGHSYCTPAELRAGTPFAPEFAPIPKSRSRV